MQATMSQSKFRGVPCLYCGNPVRLSMFLSKRENEFKRNESNLTLQWCSRVFLLRCRKCSREASYALSQIVDFGEADHGHD
jgi:hypothetical protein